MNPNPDTIPNENNGPTESGVPTILYFETIVRDTKGRTLILINKDGKVAVSRYPDITPKGQQKVLDICAALVEDNKCPEQDLEKIRQFISFQSDEDEFCS